MGEMKRELRQMHAAKAELVETTTEIKREHGEIKRLHGLYSAVRICWFIKIDH